MFYFSIQKFRISHSFDGDFGNAIRTLSYLFLLVLLPKCHSTAFYVATMEYFDIANSGRDQKVL